MKQKIFRICPVCDGTGKVKSGSNLEEDCPRCNGTGKFYWGWIKVEQEE